MVLLGAIKLGSGLAPILLAKILKTKNQWILKKFIGSVLCFGGGVLLSTVFIHLLSEVRQSLEDAVSHGEFSEDTHFPFAELLICAGFLLIHLIEAIVHKCFGDSHSPFPQPEESLVTSSGDAGVKIPRVGLVNRGFDSDDLPSKHNAQLQTEFISTSSGKTKSKGKENGIIVSVRSFLVVLALSVHSIFEGMAIGLEETKSGVWSLFLAIAIHSTAIVFCIGTEMLSSGLKKIQILIYLTVLSLVTPFGVLLGIIVTVYLGDGGRGHLLAVGILQGLAGGTLLYITFFEVLAKDKLAKYGMTGMFGALMIMIGFISMAAMQAGLGHSHGDHEGHEGHPIEKAHAHYHHEGHDHKGNSFDNRHFNLLNKAGEIYEGHTAVQDDNSNHKSGTSFKSDDHHLDPRNSHHHIKSEDHNKDDKKVRKRKDNHDEHHNNKKDDHDHDNDDYNDHGHYHS